MADEPQVFDGIEWIEFEGESEAPGTRPATYADYAAELGLTPTEERAHFEYVRQVLAERGMVIPEWKPTK